MLFFVSDEDREVSYKDKKGKYQAQVGIVTPELWCERVCRARLPRRAAVTSPQTFGGLPFSGITATVCSG